MNAARGFPWEDVYWTRSIVPLREGQLEANADMHLWVNGELRYTGYYPHTSSFHVDWRGKVARYALKTSNPAVAYDPFFFACYKPATVSRCRVLAVLLSGCLEKDDKPWRKLPLAPVRAMLEQLIFQLEYPISRKCDPSPPVVVFPGWRMCGELKYM